MAPYFPLPWPYSHRLQCTVPLLYGSILPLTMALVQPQVAVHCTSPLWLHTSPYHGLTATGCSVLYLSFMAPHFPLTWPYSHRLQCTVPLLYGSTLPLNMALQPQVAVYCTSPLWLYTSPYHGLTATGCSVLHLSFMAPYFPLAWPYSHRLQCTVPLLYGSILPLTMALQPQVAVYCTSPLWLHTSP